jgi:hypothetical protein
LKDAYLFIGECENHHKWEILQDLADMGRVNMTQMLQTDDEACEEDCDDDEAEGGPEIDLARQYN